MVRIAYSFILRYYTLVNVPVVVTSFSLFRRMKEDFMELYLVREQFQSDMCLVRYSKLVVYMSCTECKTHAVAATWSTSMSLLPQCSRAPTRRHGSPVEVVLSGNEVALLGLVEILKSPDVRHRY